MLQRLKQLFRRRRRSRTGSMAAEIAELRVAVAALLHKERLPTGNPEGAAAIESVLLHAAKARADVERLHHLYDTVGCRTAAIEREIEKLDARLATMETGLKSTARDG